MWVYFISSQAILPCLKELWSSPQLTNLSPKVVELLISTIRHFYSSEKVYIKNSHRQLRKVKQNISQLVQFLLVQLVCQFQ